jgi:Amt family ammonium transporter
MLAYIFFDAAKGRKPSALGAAIGLVIGLVAITPAAGFVNVGASIFIGVTAAIISNIAINNFGHRSNIDDTLDVFPAHGVGGITGMILTAVFANGVGLIHGEFRTFGFHLLTLLIVTVFALGGSFLLYWITDKLIGMRVSPNSEKIGLDISQHDESYGFEYKNSER